MDLYIGTYEQRHIHCEQVNGWKCSKEWVIIHFKKACSTPCSHHWFPLSVHVPSSHLIPSLIIILRFCTLVTVVIRFVGGVMGILESGTAPHHLFKLIKLWVYIANWHELFIIQLVVVCHEAVHSVNIIILFVHCIFLVIHIVIFMQVVNKFGVMFNFLDFPSWG